ncbi:MAG TPA: TolC family protein, partial [Flavobacterium sp.]|nr:TolC family protein [Flavobacterium sp.]
DLETASKKLAASKARIKAAESYYKVIEKGYSEGINSLIEYIDARNQLTASQLQNTAAQYQLLIAAAALERETASYTLKN